MSTQTSGWEFSYKLGSKIDYDESLPKQENVDFVTEIYGKQRAITGFKVTSRKTIQHDAQNDAERKAKALMALLISSSGTYSTHTLCGFTEIKESGRRRVGPSIIFSHSIRNNGLSDIPDDKFQEILNKENPSLDEKLQFMSKARQAEKTNDYEPTIKYLFLACNENPPQDLKKFKFLRHAISHNKGSLHKDTIKGLQEFGANYFELTCDNKFDWDSQKNHDNLKIQAFKFLNIMDAQLRKELSNG